MTLIVYQDGALYTDVATYTDYSGVVNMQKGGLYRACPGDENYRVAYAYAGTMESIAHVHEPKLYPRPDILECVHVRLGILETGLHLWYAENGNPLTEVYLNSSDEILMFGNNALSEVARCFKDTKYTREQPLMIEMVQAGILRGATELRPGTASTVTHRPQ